MRVRFLVIGWLIGLLLMAGCSSGDESEETSTTVIAETTTTTEPPLDLQAHAESLLVGIESEGDFLGLDSPRSVSVGSGTGIVVDTEGLILTTATSVIGAERINVFVPGVEFPIAGELDSAAECVNLALVRLDYTFAEAADMADGSAPIGVASANRQTITSGTAITTVSGPSYVFRAGPAETAGAVLFDEDGAFVGMLTGFDTTGNALALRGENVVSWVNSMRQREVVEQLGFSAVDNTEGQPVVAAVAVGGPGASLGLGIGDVITTADGVALDGGINQLCDLIEDGEATLEVTHEGRRHIGVFPDQAIILASSRTTAQIRQAVVDVNTPFGGGTGFFISADGLLVTNYHVAGGRSEVSLRLDGSDEQTPARVIGTSACADLAVLQAEGGPYQYLEWAPSAPVLEEPIRVVGFPNFTESISFQEGRVTKETTDSPLWGGFLSNFESSAQVDGGNSGGPVVNEMGEVLGVVYAIREGNKEGIWESLHLFGVEARDEVSGIIDGTIFDPSFSTYEAGFAEPVYGSGLLVEEVAPGGPADAVGIRNGDIITEFGDMDAWDGFNGLQGICEFAKDREPSAPIDVVVYRPDTASFWDGQLNGQALTEWPDDFRQSSGDNSISVVIPGTWTGYQAIEPEDGNDWVGFFAAPDIDGSSGYFEDFGTAPGLRVLWSHQRAVDETTESYFADLNYRSWGGETPFEVETDQFIGHALWFQKPDGSWSIEYAVTDRGLADSPLIVLYISDLDYLVDGTAWEMFRSMRIDLPETEQ